MPDYPPLSTQVIGTTESTLGALLEPLLAEAGLTFPQWVVLVIATARGAHGAPVDRDRLIAAVTGARKFDQAEVAAAIAELGAAAALQVGNGTVTLTEVGRARHGQVRARLTEITARLFDFPAEDLATAGRVLGVITERANTLLAAS